MLLLLAFLLVLELLTFLVLREHFLSQSKLKFYISIIINAALSIWLWSILLRIIFFKGNFDTPDNIRIRMNLTGLILAVLIPGFITVFLHYTGRLFRLRKKGYVIWLTRTGMIISCLIIFVVGISSFFGRFNFKTENVEVKIAGLDPALEGMKIVHLSDMHLASFRKHERKLEKVIEEVNGMEPDLILNTGDFISYGWREFGRCDTILSKSKSRYGNFAVLGNHDMGTYFPVSTGDDKPAIAARMKDLISASGYRLLDNENTILNIRGVNVAIAGVETSGRFPGIIHTDPGPAMKGTDSAALRILLIHDPNQWKQDVCGKVNAELTLAGHTHGMQIGIITKKIRWSPARRIYPEWNGLYSCDGQKLYVNRGLGVLATPFRIWMPPEITVITLKSL